jgi:hypothetical protein
MDLFPPLKHKRDKHGKDQSRQFGNCLLDCRLLMERVFQVTGKFVLITAIEM